MRLFFLEVLLFSIAGCKQHAKNFEEIMQQQIYRINSPQLCQWKDR